MGHSAAPRRRLSCVEVDDLDARVLVEERHQRIEVLLDDLLERAQHRVDQVAIAVGDLGVRVEPARAAPDVLDALLPASDDLAEALSRQIGAVPDVEDVRLLVDPVEELLRVSAKPEATLEGVMRRAA